MKKAVLIFFWSNVLNLAYTDPSICPKIITKEQWGSRDPLFVDYTLFPLEFVILQHTVTEPCNTLSECSSIVSGIQNYHLDNVNYGDIAYNFLVGGDGNVYEGRGWHREGAHTYGYNKKSIGIALIGNFMKVLPTEKQMQATQDLMQCGVELGELTEDYKLYAARQVTATESPGIKFFDTLKKWSHFSKT